MMKFKKKFRTIESFQIIKIKFHLVIVKTPIKRIKNIIKMNTSQKLKNLSHSLLNKNQKNLFLRTKIDSKYLKKMMNE